MLSHFRPLEKAPGKSALLALLQAYGYHTAVKTHSVFTGWPGGWIFGQFHHYQEVGGDMNCIKAGLNYFDEHKGDGPVLLLIFLHDTHAPYDPPPSPLLPSSPPALSWPSSLLLPSLSSYRFACVWTTRYTPRRGVNRATAEHTRYLGTQGPVRCVLSAGTTRCHALTAAAAVVPPRRRHQLLGRQGAGHHPASPAAGAGRRQHGLRHHQ